MTTPKERWLWLYAMLLAAGACVWVHSHTTATAEDAALTSHVLDDFERELHKGWQAWGPGGGTVKHAPSPDRQGRCLCWTFDRAEGSNKPAGLVRRGITTPPGVTQSIGWALEFWLRGATPPSKTLYLTINEADGSCWRTPKTSRLAWQQDQWQKVRVPLAHLAYAWGNKDREGTEFDITKLAAVVLVAKQGSKGTVYLDDLCLVGSERPRLILGTVLTLDTSRPPLNRYGQSRSLPRGTPTKAQPEKASAGKPSRVALRRDGVTLLNGRPFLPIGIFCVPRGSFAEVASAGFNTVLNYRGFHQQGKNVEQYLDLCAQHGLMGVVDLQTFTKRSKTGRLEPEGLADLVRRSRNHPALLAYYIADEPEYSDLPADDYVRGYQIVKKTDPAHPVIMLNNNFDAQASYAEAADLLMPDPYPNFYQVDGPMRSLSTQGEYARECLRIKPARLWFTPQFHNGACYGKKARELGDVRGRAPTLRELRFMIYSALVHGARGVIGWPYQAAGWGVRDAPEYCRGLKAVVAEVQALAPALTSSAVLSVKRRDAPDSVKAIACRHGGCLTLLAVNDSPSAASCAFAIPLSMRRLHVVSEARTISLRKGSFTDSFLPWDVHIYTTDAAVAGTDLARLLPEYVEAYSMAGTVHPTRDANLALYLHGSRARASSTNRWTRAHAAINGSYATSWGAAKPAKEHWLAVDFRRRVTVGRAILVTPANPDGQPYWPDHVWTLELKADADWTAIRSERSHFFIHWNHVLNRWERADEPSAQPRRAMECRFDAQPARALRFVCRPPKGRPSVLEIEAYAE